jgi:hypothetical protein
LTISGAGIIALLLAVVPLLVRNLLAIPVHAPLDPNEGWNAAHAIALLTGHALYPAPQSLMVNNYPPLSFYLIAGLSRHSHDPIIIGRWLSLLSFIATGVGVTAALRQMRCQAGPAVFGGLFFAAVLLITSDYVGMDDPQLLAHALQVTGLVLLLRERLILAAVLFAASLFIKHNLLALPLAAGLWLSLQEPRAGLSFLLWTTAMVLALLIVFQLHFGFSLLDQLTAPRRWAFTNLAHAVPHLWWMLLPLAAMTGAWPDRFSFLAGLYGAIALVLGLGFAGGDGVDANAFFDLVIALSLGLGLVLERGRWTEVAAAASLPLLLFLAVTFHDNDFFFTRDFRAQSASDIHFLSSRSGPVLCEQLSLCLWAGKPAEVDVFNISEQILLGSRDPSALAKLISDRHFGALQLEDLNALGPVVRNAIAAHYLIHHQDDNGMFLIPR